MLKLLAIALFVIAARPAVAAERPEIVPRAAWGAKPANTALMRPHTPREIVIHHTSVRQQPNLPLEKKLRGLQGFSQAPGKVGTRLKPAWGDAPYHFYIDVSGRIGEARDLNYAGDTNTPYDTADRILIVVEGNFEVEEPSPEQLTTLSRLVLWLAVEYSVPPQSITGHNDHAATDCPGKKLKTFLEILRARVAEGR